MTTEQNRWIGIVCGIITLIILNANLPENNVSKNLDLSGFKDENIVGKVLFGGLAKFGTTDFVADWKYRNFLVIKVAESERLKCVAIGLPFCRWFLCSTEEQQVKR